MDGILWTHLDTIQNCFSACDKGRGDDSGFVYRKYNTIMHFVSKVGTATYDHHLATQKYPDTRPT